MNASQDTLFPIITPACDACETPSIKLSFKQWKLREGERLYNKGPQHLSNTELLAHITRDIKVAERLMRHFGTLETISDVSIDELQQVCGVGESTAEMIVTAFTPCSLRSHPVFPTLWRCGFDTLGGGVGVSEGKGDNLG